MTRRLTVVALALVAGLVVLGVPTPSGATFVARTTNSVSTVAAAADWTPPAVSLRSPGTSVKDTVTLTADATDGETGVASVTIQALAPGASSWTDLCSTTSSPFTCSWSTRGGADGGWSLRATATDRAGYTTTSAAVQTTVANHLLVQLADPGDLVRGTVPLTATLFNAGTVAYSVAIQYAPTGTATWKTLCTAGAAPYSCAWSTTTNAFPSGASYDLRAVATAGSTSTTSATVVDVMVDNLAPATVMTDPGSPLRGTVTLGATASDADSGVTQVQLQWQRSGTSAWTTACTLTADPYTCRFDTASLTDGTYAFRSVATDGVGLSTTSAVVGSRTVDNTVSSVAVEDPGTYLFGTVALTATASSTAGVRSVRIDLAPSGTTGWTTVCTGTGAPYTCDWDTTAVADGLYDLRAVLIDGRGATTTSATVASRRVDNSPLRGYDVQAANGGASAGRLDAGDVLRLTCTNQVTPASISAGWTGAAVPVTVRLRDGMLLGLGSARDTVDVQRNGTTVALGSVDLRADLVKNNKAATFNATMVMGSTTVGGTSASVVTITLGSLAGGGGLRTSSTVATMVWTPSGSATDANGRPVSSAPVTESGPADRDF